MQADGGTLFLDEIGNISAMVQLRLLRFLQEKTFYPVGRDTPIQVDVRVITATNLDLKKMVESGEFREDLYFRLRVIDIILPPLREREGDVSLLVHFFITGIAKKIGREISGISDQALSQLSRYYWPGNVRELEHVLERACVLCPGATITSEQLPDEIVQYREIAQTQPVADPYAEGQHPAGQPGYPQAPGAASANAPSFEPLGRPSTEENIINALRKTGGNKAKAARLLQIDRSTLYRKIKELRIDLSVLEM